MTMCDASGNQYDHEPEVQHVHEHEHRHEEEHADTVQISPDGPDIETLLERLLDALVEVQPSNAELRQLWLEALWLQSDYKHGVLSLPSNWKLSIIAVSDGKIGTGVKRFPEIVEAARVLGQALKAYVRLPSHP